MDSKNMLSTLQKAFVIAPEKLNVGSTDRLLSAGVSGLLGYYGFKNFRKGGALLLLPAGYLLWRGITGYCALYRLTGIDTTEGAKPLQIKSKVTVNKNKNEVYNYWRQLENFPNIMTHIERVDRINNTRYHWEAELNEQKFSWDAEIIDDIPGNRISWMSDDGADIENSGTVEFKEASMGGTEIKVTINYKPDKTKLGRLVSQLFNPIFKQKVKKDMKEFKQKIESGNIYINEPAII